MHSAIRFRLYPNAEQKIALAKQFGCCRWVYNWGLNRKINAWKDESKTLHKFELGKELTRVKSLPETEWLSETSTHALHDSLENLDKAYTSFFRNKKGFPKFKTKYARQSFICRQNFHVKDGHVKVTKISPIRAVLTKEITGEIRSVSISKTATGKYFASVLIRDDVETPKKLPVLQETTLGIDLGLTHFATLSTGEKIENPRHLSKRLKRLKRSQRRLSRKKKGSNNRNKQRLVVARIHERAANCRKDFLHKLTTRLVRDNQTDSFAIEDLAVSNMVKNRRLARSISDVGWGEFRSQLEYKAERAGKNVLVIGRFEPSSKTCTCGKVNKDLKLKDRVWECECGLSHDRDLLAAQNIKSFALHPQNFVAAGSGELTLEETAQ